MPRGRRTRELMNLPWGMKNPDSSMVIVILFILAFLCKGLRSQITGYELKALEAVTVQRGLCVHIPCNFTYPTQSSTTPEDQSSDKLYVYWIKNTNSMSYIGSKGQRGSIVASSDKDQRLASFAGNRFQLTGNPAEGDCSFSINDVQNGDAGQYYFLIEKGPITKFSYSRGYTSPIVSVTELTEKPKILSSSEVVLGKSITLTCQAPGTCAWKEEWRQPKISWRTGSSTTTAQKHQHNNGSWTFASGFTFTPSLQDQGRALTCSVRYPAVGGTVENTIQLDVVYPPQDIEITRPGHPDFSTQKEKLVVREGDTISLLCEARGNPFPSVTWMKNNKTLNSHMLGRNETLQPSSVKPEDGGMYQCQAENPHGSIRKNLSVIVLYPPQDIEITRPGHPDFSAQKEKLVVREGDTVSLLCEARGNPFPSVTWVKNNKTLNNHMLGSNETLQLSSIKPEDAGMYQCQAENPHGSIRKNLSVIVQSSSELIVPLVVGLILMKVLFCFMFFFLAFWNSSRRKAPSTQEGRRKQ